MFCPKCGQSNPDDGRFCRGCGSELSGVSSALSTPRPFGQPQLLNYRGRPISLERAVTKMFSGLALLVVAGVIGVLSNGHGWWFWLLIPGFGSLGSGVAQYMHIRRLEKAGFVHVGMPGPTPLQHAQNSSLPQPRPAVTSPESRYKTGDLVPPSVTDNTTRHLEMDSEGQTMSLPKK